MKIGSKDIKMKLKYKIAFVVPRYACGRSGGAEIHCQQLAEKLVLAEHKVSILTTTAQDHYSWNNHFKTKRETINGVTVHRFEINKDRNETRFLSLQSKIDHQIELTFQEEEEWSRNSVNSRDLESFIKEHQDEYDAFIFMQYLFGTTYNCHSICPEKSLLIPCLHDENFAYLKIFKKMFNNFRGILFNTPPERELAKKIYDLPQEKTALVSLGFEKLGQIKLSKKLDQKFNFPYLLFVGRREEGKNTPLLLSYFRAYKKNN
ncbi:hexosyltransferase, partial [Candidatus Auribacterota bacterium]